jgi:hypothetical protein
MRQLPPEGQQPVIELAQRYGVSVDAVMTLLHALVHGKGTMAQFDHRELGGRGQWMSGGMVMVGNMWLGKEVILLSPPPRRTVRTSHPVHGSSNLRTPRGALML